MGKSLSALQTEIRDTPTTTPRGPERWKEELKRGKYSPVLKEIKTDFEKAAPGVTGGEDDPASPLSSGTETAADHVEVPPGRALPRPRLLPALEPSWNPRGPERGEDPSNREKFSQRSSHVLKELLKEMQKAERDGTTGTDRETVQKEPLQEGSSDTRPVSDGDTQAEQATGMSGADAGKITRAGDGKKLQKHVISVIAVVSAVLLTVTLLTCLPTLWMWRKHLERRRKRTAAGQAHPDTNWKRDQTGDKGTAELGKAAKDNVVAPKNKNLSNSSGRFSQSFAVRFALLCTRLRTDPSLQPTDPSSSPADSVSSPNTCISQDCPEPSSAPVTCAKRVHWGDPLADE